MDTSIIVVIAIIVVFVVAVPAIIRKSATELSRVEIDTVPDKAQIVAADKQTPCHDHTERARVFQAKSSIEPTVPRLDVAPLSQAPTLSLSAPVPALAVIDGHGEGQTASTEATAQSEVNVLPVAVGETRSAFLEDFSHQTHSAFASTGAPDNVRMLHPAVHRVFNQSGHGQSGHGQSGHGQSGQDSGGRGQSVQGSSGHAATRSGTTGSSVDRIAPAANRPTGPAANRPSGPDTNRPGRPEANRPSGPATTDMTRRGTQIPNPNFGTDEEHSMTEKATTLRESIRSLGTMVRGFALLFLASALGILVSGVLAIFSVVHPALIGVFAGLAVVSLFIVRTLNLRKRELKARLRNLERNPAKAAAPRTAGPRAAREASTTSTATKTTDAAATAAGSTKAAQARAVMQRNVVAKRSREEADTGEIPIVRIRSEAAEGHTTRQVLLTGPIPVVAEKPETTSDAAGSTAESDGEAIAEAVATRAVEKTASAKTSAEHEAAGADADSTHVEAGRIETDRTDVDRSDVDRADSAVASSKYDASPEADEAKTADSTTEEPAASVNDPFMQRLKARDAWSPTPLPVPSYVDAPQVDHPTPEATTADAASYETEARSREDIAAQFAAELGYRAELSDSAREDSPLEHGRKAIRTTKAPELGAVDDVLARRRA